MSILSIEYIHRVILINPANMWIKSINEINFTSCIIIKFPLLECSFLK